jgi:hypothetical protein
MSCEFAFLAVGNADSIVVSPQNGPSILVDVPKPRAVTDFLRTRVRLHIACIYITHAHNDHFAPMSRFVAFLEQWFALGGLVDNIFIATEIFDAAFEELDRLKKRVGSKEFKELHHAMERLIAWRERTTHFEPPVKNSTPSYQSGDLAIYVLHPEQLFAARHRVTSKRALNERSVVLKVIYKRFVALLLADLDKDGLDDCVDLCSSEDLKADLVKIPHHGAWPINSSTLESLLRMADAKIAVLCVGSKNSYGHVVPALFRLLNALVADMSLRLQKFLCTEVTRTCTLSSAERISAGKRGLLERMPCAGNIIVNVDDTFTLDTQTDHPSVVSGLKFSACEHRMDY